MWNLCGFSLVLGDQEWSIAKMGNFCIKKGELVHIFTKLVRNMRFYPSFQFGFTKNEGEPLCVGSASNDATILSM
jgi:hypothetical protein